MEHRLLLKLFDKSLIKVISLYKYKIICFLVLITLGTIQANGDELRAIDKIATLQVELENFFAQKTSNKSEWRNLRKILLPFFDLRSTNQSKWEKVWINASELEKERILGYLAQYIIFEADKHKLDFNAENVVYLNEHNSKNRAVVDTFIKIGKSRQPISIRFRNSKSSWMIYDIFLDEISLIEAWKKLNDAIDSSDSFEIVLKKIKSKNIR